MLSWQVGAVKVTRVVELEIPVRQAPERTFLPEATLENLKKTSWLFPHFADDEGTLKLSIHALLVEAPGLKLVVDTCIGNDRPRGITGGRPLTTPFLERLAEAGCQRDEVNAVVCTHLHVDHVGWNTMRVDGQWVPTFPNARYLLGRTEYEHWMAESEGETSEILADSVSPIFEAGLAELVPLDYRISPEVRLTPTTGHTPGHVSVVIESEGQKAVITGDMSHHPCQMAHPEWATGFDSDAPAAAATRRRMFAEWADEPTLVIGTHYAAPTAGRIRRDGDVFKFEV